MTIHDNKGETPDMIQHQSRSHPTITAEIYSNEFSVEVFSAGIGGNE